MKLKMTHKTYNLDMELPLQDRVKAINDLLGEDIIFHEEVMTVEEYFRHTWNKQNTKISLDIIGYYLTKENRDLEVLSTKKQLEMETGSKRHTTFTSMGYDNQVALGLVDIED